MSPPGLRRYRAERPRCATEFDRLRGRCRSLALVRAGSLRARGVAATDAERLSRRATSRRCAAAVLATSRVLRRAARRQTRATWRRATPPPGRASTARAARARDRQPAGWLVLVTLRRAVEELRRARAATRARWPAMRRRRSATSRASSTTARGCASCSRGCAAASSPREREAAALCYLHGLSRAEAAARMGISERAHAQADGGPRARAAPGVAAKVGRAASRRSARGAGARSRAR